MWVVFDYVFTYWKGILTILIPFALLPIPLILESKPNYFSNNKYNKNTVKPFADDESKCGAMVALMALYWMLDLIPMAATALIPVALCPLMALMGTNDISMAYFKATNMLFLGSELQLYRQWKKKLLMSVVLVLLSVLLLLRVRDCCGMQVFYLLLLVVLLLLPVPISENMFFPH